jgi:allophanate hydrolase
MTRALQILSAGLGVSVQDMGRPGLLAMGISRGGAADPVAIAEGAVLLGQSADLAVLEMAGMGGQFTTSADVRIALTGAEMQVDLDGQALRWNASHVMPKGSRLNIGAAKNGTYGYLSVGGGFGVPLVMGSRSTHVSAGIGHQIIDGGELPIGIDQSDQTGLLIEPIPRFGGGVVRISPSVQTSLFQAELHRFEMTEFTRDMRGNRMGVRMDSATKGFGSDLGLSLLSEVIVPGDIQITGDGSPFVLLCECQTTGGYPRIGTVLPCDLPRVVQARPGTSLQFQFVELENAIAAEQAHRAALVALPKTLKPLLRNPHDMMDLLSYDLISGMITGTEEDKT